MPCDGCQRWVDAHLRTRPRELSHLVLVYGTLKAGFYNHESVMQPLQGHFALLAERATVDGFLFVDAYYIPYLVVDKAALADASAEGAEFGSGETAPVGGELYAVDDEMLAALDELEGIAQGRYTRSRVRAQFDDGGSRECWIYHLRSVPARVREKGMKPLTG